MPLVEPELNDIMAYHMAIALPASVIDELSGGAIAMALTPVLRKLSHWYFQDCFSSMQGICEDCHLQAIAASDDSIEKARWLWWLCQFHNAFTGFSWCGIVNSDMQNDCHYWTFPLRVLTAIVLEIPLADLASLTHCSSYCNYNPPEAYHRHCSFPIGMQGVQEGRLFHCHR